jgi:chromosome segregation ATPase
MRMAARRKKVPSDGAEASRAFAVVVEEMRGHFKVFGERLAGLDEKVTAGFARVDERLDRIDERVTNVEHRLTNVEDRLTNIEHRLTNIEHRLTNVEGQLAELSHEVGLVKDAVLEHARALKSKVNRDEVEAIVERVTGRG